MLMVSSVVLLACAGARAESRKDAAEVVQEGSVPNWLEYYRRERGRPAGETGPAPAAPQPPREPGDKTPTVRER